jgi:hypothetical protein
MFVIEANVLPQPDKRRAATFGSAGGNC